MAIPAIARLVAEGHHIKWYIIGDGERADKEMLRASIKEHGIENYVSFLGVKKNPYPYMKACDIYFQPSRHEGKPIAVEEAKILGKPIFLTNFSSAKEQLEKYFFGEIEEISSEGIFLGLRKLLLRASEMKKMRYNRQSCTSAKNEMRNLLDKLLE